MAPKLQNTGTDRVLLIDLAAQQRQQFAEDMDEYRKHPIDRAKARSGYFLNFDGSGAHDANGNPVPMRAEDKEHANDLRRRNTFNREPGAESDDVETSAPAQGGSITSYPPSLTDSGVRMVEDAAPASDKAARKSARRGKKGAARKSAKRSTSSRARKSKAEQGAGEVKTVE